MAQKGRVTAYEHGRDFQTTVSNISVIDHELAHVVLGHEEKPSPNAAADATAGEREADQSGGTLVIFEASDACQKARSDHSRKSLIPWGAGAEPSLGQNDNLSGSAGGRRARKSPQ